MSHIRPQPSGLGLNPFKKKLSSNNTFWNYVLYAYFQTVENIAKDVLKSHEQKVKETKLLLLLLLSAIFSSAELFFKF